MASKPIPQVELSEKAKKAAIYVRVSTNMQVDKDSLQVQKRELIVYSEMVLNVKDYFIFEDAGYSAKNTDRPDYQKMMARLRSGEFTHLLVWKIDRISRNLLDFAAMYAELKFLGITFVSKNEQFDTSSAMGEAMLKIILVFAELERQMTAERVTAVMLSRANNGQWNGGKVPYGYQYDKSKKTFSCDPIEAPIVERIFSLYERYTSTTAVARYLNDHNIRTRRGNEWSSTAVHICLTNPWYVGDYLYNVHDDGKGSCKRAPSEWLLTQDHHVPIIDRYRFDCIQESLRKNARSSNGQKSYVRKNIHIFAGIMKCGLCGSSMTATPDRERANGWRPSAYACSAYRRKSSKCKNKFITDVTLGPFVMTFVSNIVRAKGRIGPRTSLDQLQKILLHGDALSDITSINRDALEMLHSMLLSGETGVEYRPIPKTEFHSEIEKEFSLLHTRKNKYEQALGRLQSMYLYGDSQMSEKDYIIERQKIIADLEATERRLTELQENSSSLLYDPDEMIERASYFIMAQKLISDHPIDYKKYFSKIDPSVVRSFIRAIIREIIITNGVVSSIEFNSGVKCTFSRE